MFILEQTFAKCQPGARTHCTGAVAAQDPPPCPAADSTHHVHRAENVAIVVAGLQVLGDVGEGTEVLRVLGCTGNVPDLVLCDDVLRGKQGLEFLGSLRAHPSPFTIATFLSHPSVSQTPLPPSLRGGGWHLTLSDLGLGSPPLTMATEGANVHTQPTLLSRVGSQAQGLGVSYAR